MHHKALIAVVLFLCLSAIASRSLLAQTPATATAAPAASAPPLKPLPKVDWANLGRYEADNAALAAPARDEKRVVFMGDSITDGWGRSPGTGTFFPGKPYLNRGIGGQTTPQMLIRFQQDVVHLKPAVVVILAGTNDIAGNTGPSTPEMIEDNLTSMAQIARSNGIRVVLASITPVYDYPWKPKTFPTPIIRAVNQWMQTYCAANHCTYLDYYSAMADPNGAMLPGMSRDGVHPLEKGYAVMAPLAEQAIATALSHKP